MKQFFCMVTFLLVFTAGVAYAQKDQDESLQDESSVQSEEVSESPAPEYKNFKKGQRIGTWALNAFVFPGLGSFVVMHDVLGGSIQLALGGAGLGLSIAGVVLIFRDTFNYAFKDQWGEEGSLRKKFNASIGLIVVGGVAFTGNFVFNIIRSAKYDRPQPKIGSLADINAWSLAVLPGESGVGQVQLAYTLRL